MIKPKKPQSNVKWEDPFEDQRFYGMWAVRPVGDHDFNSPRLFHFVFEDEAWKFKEMIEKCCCAVRNT